MDDLKPGDRVLIKANGWPCPATVHVTQPADKSKVRVALDMDPNDTWDLPVRNILEAAQPKGARR